MFAIYRLVTGRTAPLPLAHSARLARCRTNYCLTILGSYNLARGCCAGNQNCIVQYQASQVRCVDDRVAISLL